ncbi:MAG: helix-turn-helix domain-containing protein [Sphaerochaetaceae bacterium]|nr:helix-turn-helix domain-containing protein [Sphaerochaetaceae bacterium]
MLKDNLVMLRNIHGYSQEAVSEKIGISRQAYAKWESGDTIPDIEKCSLLAELYGTTIDSLVNTEPVEGVGMVPPAPRGKNIWGSVAIGERGQIVIPKGARDLFGLTGGQRLIVLSDEQGIALIPHESFMAKMKKAMEEGERKIDE